jgi:uncharacterized YccA/Bax inhibitor family protein
VAVIEVVKEKGMLAHFQNVPGIVYSYLVMGALSAFAVAIFTIFNPRIAFLTAPVYALLEGFALGATSALYQHAYGGYIVANSIGLTFTVMFAMLLLYVTRIIRPSERFRSAVISATFGVVLFYLLDLVLGLFGFHAPGLFSTGFGGILISLVIVGIAAANLILDFDQIDVAIQSHAPKYLEWYMGFGLMITLVWLYLQIIDLYAKMQDD